MALQGLTKRPHRTPEAGSPDPAFSFVFIFQPNNEIGRRDFPHFCSTFDFFQKSVFWGLRVRTFLNISPLTPATGAHRL
ncbi:hypothetical protein, partial [Brucella ciceri]|uniref:hypothetical protein n=1 Tax=Brucella ciceri TaxID=391287 RepID=UPI0035BC336E